MATKLPTLPPFGSEAVSSSTKYDFWLASVQLTNTKIGEADRVYFFGYFWVECMSSVFWCQVQWKFQACFPVFSVMPRLKPEADWGWQLLVADFVNWLGCPEYTQQSYTVVSVGFNSL